MKSFFKFGMLAVLTLAFCVFPDQVSAAAHSVDSLAFLGDLIAPTPGVTLGATVLLSLGNMDGTSYQTPNPGGIRRLFAILRRDITGVWPKLADIVDGEITVAPTLRATAKFAEYEVAPDTASMGDDDSGDPGFQSYKHSVELMIAGISKSKAAELRKHLNAGAVLVAELNDGQMVVAGSSDNAIYLKKSFTTGKKGSDKRGTTIKGEQDGFMWGVMPLKAEIASALPLDPVTAV